VCVCIYHFGLPYPCWVLVSPPPGGGGGGYLYRLTLTHCNPLPLQARQPLPTALHRLHRRRSAAPPLRPSPRTRTRRSQPQHRPPARPCWRLLPPRTGWPHRFRLGFNRRHRHRPAGPPHRPPARLQSLGRTLSPFWHRSLRRTVNRRRRHRPAGHPHRPPARLQSLGRTLSPFWRRS